MLDFAPCKINLGLDILRRRPDGYHDIDTVMLRVPWHDIIEIIPSSGDTDTLTVSGRKVDCPPERNLVMRAVRAVRTQCDFPTVDIYLHKIVPDGAGLGGGSSDAGTAARLVNRIFSLGLSDFDLAEVLSTVGSDCPFFAYDCPMHATGTGTDLKPFTLPILPPHIIIVKPHGCAVSTAAAYAGVHPSQPSIPLTEALSNPVETWKDTVKNDFEPSVFAAAPAIGKVKETMYRLGAVYASMSGSGAAVYGLFDMLPTLYPDTFPEADVLVSDLAI